MYKLKKYLEEKIRLVNEHYEELLTDIYGIKVINIMGLSNQEKEEIINKRNCLLIQKSCYEEILKKINKENNNENE